jgi:hypothetical protein
MKEFPMGLLDDAKDKAAELAGKAGDVAGQAKAPQLVLPQVPLTLQVAPLVVCSIRQRA